MAPLLRLLLALAGCLCGGLLVRSQQTGQTVIQGFNDSSYTVNEGEIITLRVLLSDVATSDVTFDVITQDGTQDGAAVAPGDYDSLASTLTITAGNTEQLISILIKADNITENRENFRVVLRNPSAGIAIVNSAATVNIIDLNDAIVGFNPTVYSIVEAENVEINLIVELFTTTERQLEVVINITSGTAQPREDYSAFAITTITISSGNAAGDTFSTPIFIVNDNIFEPAESFTAAINANPAERLFPIEGRATATANILDDDGITIGFDRTEYSVMEGASSLAISIRLVSTITAADVIVTLTTEDVTASSSGESDFVAQNTNITLSSMNTEETVMIVINDDTALEHSEQFNCTLTLVPPTLPHIQLNPSVAIVTIIDNDNVVIGFNQTAYEVSEGEPSITVYVELLTGTLQRQVLVNVAINQDTALDGSDYTHSLEEQQLTFDMNTRVVGVTIDIIDNGQYEEEEQFFVRLSSSDSGVMLNPFQTVVGILDDDVVAFAFRQQAYTFMESVESAVVCVDKNGTTEQTITVTMVGSLLADTVDNTLVFPPNLSSICVPLNITDDDIALEAPEVFTLELVQPEDPLLRVQTNPTMVVIVDDDEVIVGFNPTVYNVSEGAGNVTLMVERRGAIAQPLVVSITTEGGTSSENINEVSSELTFSHSLEETAVQNFVIPITDDMMVESNEQIRVYLNVSHNGVVTEPEGEVATINILNDDDIVILIDIGFEMMEYITSESSALLTAVVVVNGNVSRPFSITVQTLDGTAIAGKDFQVSSTQLTITPGSTTVPVNVAIFDNSDTVSFKNFSLLLSTEEITARITTQATSVYIFDDDFPPPTVETIGPMNIIDGQPTTFVCIVTAASGNISVHWLDENGDIIGNDNSTSSEYSVGEELLQRENSSLVVSTLNTTRFSLSAHLLRPLSCVGRVGNPVFEREAMKSIPELEVQFEKKRRLPPSSMEVRAPFVFLNTSPEDVTLGKNLTVTCTSSTTYGLDPDTTEVMTNIVWEVSYELDGEVVNTVVEANSTSDLGVTTSELSYSPILLAMNFTCSSYVSSSNENVTDSALSQHFSEVIPQEPNINVTLAIEPQIVLDVPPYNNFTLTCIAMVPYDLLPLQLSFMIHNLNQSYVIAQSLNYSTIEDCEVTTDSRLCVFSVDGAVQEDNSLNFREFVCLVDLFSSAILGSPPVERLVTLTQAEYAESLIVNVPSLPAALTNPRIDAVSHNLAIIQWTVPYLTYTPETYYIQFTVIGGDNQIFVSPTIEGTTDLAAMNVEYKFVLKGLDNGTTYVANIVANNTYGGQVSEDIFFTTNPFDIFPVVAAVDGTTPLGAPIDLVFNINDGDSGSVNESTSLTFIALLHTPLTQPSQIFYDDGLNRVIVTYDHATPSLIGEYIVCREAPVSTTGRRKRGSLLPGVGSPQLCSDVIVINVTIPTLSLSTNLLIQSYMEFDGKFFIEGGSPSVTCSPSDARAPVQWSPDISDVDPAYQAMLSPPGTLTFPSVYESEPPSVTIYFSCSLINLESDQLPEPHLIVTFRFIKFEIAVLNNDNELVPNSIINDFSQTSFFLPCLGVSGHRNLTWESQVGTHIPYVETASDTNNEELPLVYQSDYLGARRLYINSISIDTADYYSCRSQQSGFVVDVLITLTNPYFKLTSPTINYIPVGGRFSFISVQYADNSTGYQNFGAGFSYTLTFTPDDNTQSEILESELRFDFNGNEHSYGDITRLIEQDGVYRINATHIETGVEYIDSVEVQIIIPHFVSVDRSVFSHIGDLLSLTCQPNDTVATVIWLTRDSDDRMEVLTESSQPFTFTPSELNHLVTFNATQYASDSSGQDSLPEFQFVLTCSFINGENVSDLISPIDISIRLQEERIRMSLGSSRNSSILNNTIINSITLPSTMEQQGSGMEPNNEQLLPLPDLTVECTATQGDHQPLWMMPFNRADNSLSEQYVDNYTARLELFNVSRANESPAQYTCHSQISGRHTQFFLTRENPYIRKVSPSVISAMAGDSVTLEFTVALNSNGVTTNTDDVVFTFSNFNGDQPVTISSFEIADRDLPHNFVYTIEKVNPSHAGVYTTRAPRQDCETEGGGCGDVSASITLNVTSYCPEEFNGGLIWPRTLSNTSVSLPCRRADPFFELRTKTTRYCDLNGVWSPLDLSTCTLVEESLTFLLVWFVLEAPPDPNQGITDEELEQELTAILNNQSVTYKNISLELIRDSMTVGTPVRVEITLTSNQQAVDVSQFFQFFSFIGAYTVSNENRGFSLVSPNTTCSCTASNSTSIALCSGYTISPCRCTVVSECECQPPYVGDGIHCTVDSDGDSYPDASLLSPKCSTLEGISLEYCITDNCPQIFNPDQNGQACQSISFSGCQYEVDDIWGVSWPNTQHGSTTTQVCPGGIDAVDGTATRLCAQNGQWGEPDVLQCTSIVFLELLDLAELILNIVDPEEQVLQGALLTEQLIDATEPQDKPLLPNDLEASADIVTTVVNVLENNNSTEENVIDVFNNVLHDNNREGWRILHSVGRVTSSEQLLNSAERYAMTTAMSVNVSGDGDQGVQTMRQSRQNIVVVGEQHREPPIIDLQFPLPEDLLNYTTSRKTSTISIPSSLIQEQLGKLRDGENLPVFFVLLRNLPMGIFVVNSSTRANSDTACVGRNFTTQGASDVLAAQVGSESNNISLSGSMQESLVNLNFTFESNNASALDSYNCVFWNFTDPIGNGTWLTTGVTKHNVTTQNTDAGNFTTVRCSSNHLTSFAVLVDVAGGLQVIDEAERVALQVVSYVGCAISIICLAVTVTFFLWQLYHQRRIPDAKRVKTAQTFIHLNLSLSLLLAYIVFVVGVETAKGSKGGCVFVAVLLHYLFLCAFCWMLCEGILLYLLLRVVFSEMSKKWWPFLLIGYVTPLPIVVITVGIRHEYYGVRDSCGDLLYCWLSVEEGTIFGFVAPMLAIILINVLFLVLALQTLWKTRRRQIERKHDSTVKASQELGRALFVATVVLLPILGLTWAFGILTVNQNSTAFAWLFTIFNSLQGVFIFFFHVIRSDKVWSKIRPKLLFLRSKVPWVSSFKWQESSMATGETHVHSKTKSTEASTLPRDHSTQNWILVGKEKRFYKTPGLSSSTADSLNSPSNYELKSHLHPVTNEISEAGTETKIDLGTIEKSVDAGLADSNESARVAVRMTNISEKEPHDELVNANVSETERHVELAIAAGTVGSTASPKPEALLVTESLEKQYTAMERNEVETHVEMYGEKENNAEETNQKMDAKKKENKASNSVITDTKKERKISEVIVVTANPSLSVEVRFGKVPEAVEMNSKFNGEPVVIENPTALKETSVTKQIGEHIQNEGTVEQSKQNTEL